MIKKTLILLFIASFTLVFSQESYLTTGSADFSKYVAVGASFTSGFTDGALFKAAQENTFPNILSKKFAMAGGGDFKQPLMNDNFGGLLLGGSIIQPPRLYLNGVVPTRLTDNPTTEVSDIQTGPFNNMGVPGAKSFHLGVNGYGNVVGVATGLANPYFVRMASSPNASILEDVLAQSPTFFTLSEIGGNDVLSYAISGGTGVDQTGNIDPSTYGADDITDPNVFASAFTGIVDALTSGGAKGVVANIPYITSLSHFTTVPYNPVPLSAEQVAELNPQLKQLITILTILGHSDRLKLVTAGENNRLLIKDETLTDLSVQITGAATQAGIPALQAKLIGGLYGQVRHANNTDLFTLPTASIIGTEKEGIPAPFNVVGVTYPLEDVNVLIPSEQMAIKTAIDAYNSTIKSVATAKKLAFVDFKSVLEEASNTGVQFDEFNLTTQLVFGGLVSLDGIHLTARGYALMAKKILEAIDDEYGSNFKDVDGGLPKAANYITSYPETFALSVNNFKYTSFKIYPNPVKGDILNLIQLENKRVSKLIIFNIEGKKVIEIKNPTSKINLSPLNKGIYIIQLISDRKIEFKKIIKN